MSSQVRIVDLPGGGGKDAKDEGKKSPSSSRRSSSRKATSESDLKSRLRTVFERIADAADARGDEELAETVRDDMDVMANGLASLTRPFTALRTPLLLLLSIVEPVMAFSRIGRLMVGRMMVRRATRAAERATDQPPEGVTDIH